MNNGIDRRQFLKQAGVLTAAATLPMGLVNVVWGKKPTEKFTFAYISDAHITQIKGTEFVANFDKGLKRAVLELAFMDPKPDFVVFGGDLAQLGKREEIDHGLELMKDVTIPIKWVMGEHDYYLDLGAYWREKFGPDHYSFDHKGVHFVVLNSILTHDDWTFRKWPTPEARMLAMARLDNPEGSPFMVKNEQLAWLKKDLARVDRNTPLVVLSHSPLYKIFKPWNFWTDDAEKVQAILKPFRDVKVLHGHVHQVLYNQIGSITFNSFMATAWPWPYPVSYNQQPNKVPEMTVFMNRADPFKERDGTGWGAIDMNSGIAHHYELWENSSRTVQKTGTMKRPEDAKFQDPAKRLPAQTHY